jgi:hypothetical protein
VTAKESLDLRECLFYWIQIRRVWRKKLNPNL